MSRFTKKIRKLLEQILVQGKRTEHSATHLTHDGQASHEKSQIPHIKAFLDRVKRTRTVKDTSHLSVLGRDLKKVAADEKKEEKAFVHLEHDQRYFEEFIKTCRIHAHEVLEQIRPLLEEFKEWKGATTLNLSRKLQQKTDAATLEDSEKIIKHMEQAMYYLVMLGRQLNHIENILFKQREITEEEMKFIRTIEEYAQTYNKLLLRAEKNLQFSHYHDTFVEYDAKMFNLLFVEEKKKEEYDLAVDRLTKLFCVLASQAGHVVLELTDESLMKFYDEYSKRKERIENSIVQLFEAIRHLLWKYDKLYQGVRGPYYRTTWSVSAMHAEEHLRNLFKHETEYFL